MSADRWVMVPRDVLERAATSLGAFVSDEGWSQADMDNMDALDAALAAAPAAPAAEPYAFVQHMKGFAPRLFLASDVGLDFPNQEWVAGVSVEPLYRGAAPAAESPEPTMLTDEQIAVLTMMLDHYAGDPRTECLRPLVRRGSKP